MDAEKEADPEETQEGSEESNGEKCNDDKTVIKLPMISLEAFRIFLLALFVFVWY